MRKDFIAVCIVLCSMPIHMWSQALEFEAASVKMQGPEGSRSPVSSKGGPGTADPTLWTCNNYPLMTLVRLAFDKSRYEVSGPSWMDEERFSIRARIAEHATKEDFRVMLQRLLGVQFKLQFHLETRMLSTFDMVAGKKARQRLVNSQPTVTTVIETAERSHVGEDGFPVIPKGSHVRLAITNGRGRILMPDETMADFAHVLSVQLRAPVIDNSDLTGRYYISLYWDARDRAAPGEELGPNLIEALKEQLGLELRSRKGPVQVLVVDHAERTPLEN